MPPFDVEASWDRLDLHLLQNGFVQLYWQRGVLADDVRTLQGLGYAVVEVQARAWASEADLHRDLAAALGFPRYYGRNLNALNDCLGDVALAAYGRPPASTGLTLVLHGFDAFTRVDRPAAQRTLDAFARQARVGALFGNRLLCLVQSDDPDMHLEPVGATSVTWNPSEWTNAQRSPDRPTQ